MAMRPYKTGGRPIPRYRGKQSRTIMVPSPKNRDVRTFDGIGEAGVGLEAEFDPGVKGYRTQVRENFANGGKQRRGSTDVVVELVDGTTVRTEVVLDKRLARPAIQARLAGKKAAAEARGERFRVVLHSEAIREPQFTNRMFLVRGLRYPLQEEALQFLRDFLFQRVHQKTAVADAIRALRARGYCAEVLYGAMAQRHVGFDMGALIRDLAEIWWVG